jgi:hypothetical protein
LIALDAATASRYAQLALKNIVEPWPHKLDHLISGPEDLTAPRVQHPAFWGSYDWHSCVHMHWSLARLLRLFPDLPERNAVAAAFDAHLNRDTIAGELAYLAQPGRGSFERPYGWGWLLKLAAELVLLTRKQGTADLSAKRWAEALAPLATAFHDRFIEFLPRADYPNRAGTHGNSAFALLLALDACDVTTSPALTQLIHRKAHDWFGRDRRYPAEYEPSGSDFLSAGLCEAALMSRVVDGCDYADWWQAFRPTDAALATWLTPAKVSDRIDPQIVHLDGLNLSRVWCWRMIAAQTDVPREVIERAIDAHLAASLPHVAVGDFGATHWLASFALLALTEPVVPLAGPAALN